MDPNQAKLPRKELQGPRPAPLKIHKDSHKIRKPPLGPSNPHAPPNHPHAPPLQLRQPVIIYTVSPKIIHTNPSEFMNLVQRLTGLSSSSNSNPDPNPTSEISAAGFGGGFSGGGDVSPAARYAAIEKANNSTNNSVVEYVKGFGGEFIMGHATSSSNNNNSSELGLGLGFDQEMMSNSFVNNRGFFSGILSPGPGSLPAISPGFFSSSPSDTFFNDLMISPAIIGSGQSSGIGFITSPNSLSASLFVSPSTHHLISSPTTPNVDHLFNNIFSDN